MTADELAAMMYEEQGFVSLGADVPMEIGDVADGIKIRMADVGPLDTPLRVTGPSTPEEFMEQYRLACRLTTTKPTAFSSTWRYHYRVEAAD